MSLAERVPDSPIAQVGLAEIEDGIVPAALVSTPAQGAAEGLFALLAVIGSLAGMGKDPLLALAWLVGAGSILGLVVWAFARRWQAPHPRTPAP